MTLCAYLPTSASYIIPEDINSVLTHQQMVVECKSLVQQLIAFPVLQVWESCSISERTSQLPSSSNATSSILLWYGQLFESCSGLTWHTKSWVKDFLISVESGLFPVLQRKLNKSVICSVCKDPFRWFWGQMNRPDAVGHVWLEWIECYVRVERRVSGDTSAWDITRSLSTAHKSRLWAVFTSSSDIPAQSKTTATKSPARRIDAQYYSYSVTYLREVLCQVKVYIRPTQQDLRLEPQQFDITPALSVHFSFQSLQDHSNPRPGMASLCMPLLHSSDSSNTEITVLLPAQLMRVVEVKQCGVA